MTQKKRLPLSHLLAQMMGSRFDHAERELWQEPPDPLFEAIAKLLTAEDPEWQGSATELIAVLGLDAQANALTKKLNVKAGRLRDDYHIGYENVHSRTGSRIRLTLIAETT